MPTTRIIHVERIEQDPLLGHVSGVAIRQGPDGATIRQPVTARVRRATLPHEEAAERLRRAAERPG